MREPMLRASADLLTSQISQRQSWLSAVVEHHCTFVSYGSAKQERGVAPLESDGRDPRVGRLPGPTACVWVAEWVFNAGVQ